MQQCYKSQNQPQQKMQSTQKSTSSPKNPPKWDNNGNSSKQNVDSIVVVKYEGLHVQHSIIPILHKGARRKQDNQNWKFQNVLSSEPKGRFSRLSQVKESAIRVYQQNRKNGSIKSIDRLTFGPERFRAKVVKIQQQKEQNPELILPITHQKQQKSRSSSKLSAISESKIKPKIFEIMKKQLKMSDSKILGLKEQTLNYELQKFVRKKGLQYLQQNRQRSYRAKTQGTLNTKLKIQPVFISSETSKNKKKSGVVKKLQKYPNYIPEVFPKIQRSKNSKKTIVSLAAQSEKKSQQKAKPKNKNEKKIDSLNDREEMLGKIVYDKVQDYFKLNDKKANYFSRVKSEEKIDEAWIEYLKTKIDRADLVLKQKV